MTNDWDFQTFNYNFLLDSNKRPNKEVQRFNVPNKTIPLFMKTYLSMYSDLIQKRIDKFTITQEKFVLWYIRKDLNNGNVMQTKNLSYM